ncbi:MAG: ATP-binding protein [Candidatus Omnitrophota bacterium]
MKPDKVEAKIINIDLPAKSEYLEMSRLVTSVICQREHLSAEKEEDIKIVIGEAYINVTNHAYNHHHEQLNRINIRYLLYPEKLVIVVKDFGKGFDPYFVQKYIKRQDVQRPERVGLGIFLIKTLTDELEYDSSPAGGTQVRLTKYK